jgi:hypothetical protein|tara:strand:+ start:347 stop:544 length:198 start_codon:yes stop_codon:yes gene_type:complete
LLIAGTKRVNFIFNEHNNAAAVNIKNSHFVRLERKATQQADVQSSVVRFEGKWVANISKLVLLTI